MASRTSAAAHEDDAEIASRPANLLHAAALDAQRRLLRKTLRAAHFNISETARRLAMVGPSGIVQARAVQLKIATLGLREWFDEQRAARDARASARSAA